MTFQLPGFEPDDQFLVARIVSFPSHGTLHDVYVNGSIGGPIVSTSSLESEVILAQWVSSVVGFSSEWTVTEDFLASIGATRQSVLAGNVSQVCIGLRVSFW